MAAHRSVSIAIYGVRLVRTTITCASHSKRESAASAAGRSSSVSSLLNEAPIFVLAARNLLWSEKGRSAVQCTAREVCEGDIDGCRDIARLTTMERERKGNVAAAITGRMLIEGHILIVEMHDGCRHCAAHACDIFGQASINGDGRIPAGSIVRCPRATTIGWNCGDGRQLRLKRRVDCDGFLCWGLVDGWAACTQQHNER